MKIKAFIEKTNENKTVELKEKSIVLDLLKKLNINPTTVIISKNNEIVIGEEKLKNNDKIDILSVISGG